MAEEKFKKFERIIVDYWAGRGVENSACPFWGEDGRPELEYDLLDRIVKKSIEDGDVGVTQNGGLANGLDMWIAGELRAAGFEDEQPWLRLQRRRSF